MTIYIDILIITNIIINYFLLLLTVHYCLSKTNRKNIFISSLIGGIYSLITLLPRLSFVIILLSKLLCCFFMTIITFGKQKIFKNYYSFLIINFIFSGLMMTLWFFIYPPGMKINNGIVYFHISTLTLIISIAISYLLINIFSVLTKQVPIDIVSYTVEIYIDDKHISLKGFVDTGNFLHDIFSATPVVICKLNSISSILPQCIKNTILNNNIENTQSISKYHIRFIPYQTINSQQFIIAFKPDKFILKTFEKQIFINDVYLGLISDDNLINKEYDIILNPRLIK